jgi:hypothetical protein
LNGLAAGLSHGGDIVHDWCAMVISLVRGQMRMFSPIGEILAAHAEYYAAA